MSSGVSSRTLRHWLNDVRSRAGLRAVRAVTLRDLRSQVLVVGLGRFGSAVAAELVHLGFEVAWHGDRSRLLDWVRAVQDVGGRVHQFTLESS